MERVPLSIGKVSDPSDHISGHTTLPVKYGGKESMAILDSGAGIGIATKPVWIKWGKPTLYKVCMSLQLTDGSLNTPLKLVEDITMESCGIQYSHTFAIVDFGESTNYEVILGRPFMRQFKMLQDWGFDYLYLRQETSVTRVNLKNHSYRNGTALPMEEFDSASSEGSFSNQSSIDKQNVWMCNASTRASLQPDGSEWCKVVMDGTYTPYPCKEECFEPIEWPHILSTLDVCTNPKPLQFCTPEAYDIHPFLMLSSLHPRFKKKKWS